MAPHSSTLAWIIPWTWMEEPGTDSSDLSGDCFCRLGGMELESGLSLVCRRVTDCRGRGPFYSAEKEDRIYE